MVIQTRSQISLLSRNFGSVRYTANCANCHNFYQFMARENEGSADFVEVYCSHCGYRLGRVREDFGGDFQLSKKDEIDANKRR